MPTFCPLFSGSSGNSTYIATPRGGILIDAGVSAKRVCEALTARGIDPATLQAIFVTHEHVDHTAGVRVLAKKFDLPVIASYGTLSAIEPAMDAGIRLAEMPAEGIELAGMRVTAFSLSHDAAQPTGYTVTFADDRRLAIATDTGILTEDVRRALCGCETVLLESNHDVTMLKNGPYPYPLKQRILGAYGHLSNDTAASLLPYLVESGTTRVVLGHLSQENNTPKQAELTARSRLAAAGLKEHLDYRLSVAGPVSADPVIIL
ncbi:MAG: MBL fold metallo-hydrolase [Clostridia bacterium]|nr:MBL fold metallo-hydrolase [Clostridia bacterium]